jgi:hypothetical protein
MTILLPGSQQGSGRHVKNASAAAQTPAAATRTYIAGSALKVPVGGLKVGDVLRWVFNMTKTAAGTATSTIDIAFGTAATTADTARVSFTKPAGTAVVDEGRVVVEAVVQSVSATGVVVGIFNLTHNLAATGHAQIPSVNVATVSAGFDNDGEDLYVGLCITTGASDAITITFVSAELTAGS